MDKAMVTLTQAEILARIDDGKAIAEPDYRTRKRITTLRQRGTIELVRYDSVGPEGRLTYWYRRPNDAIRDMSPTCKV